MLPLRQEFVLNYTIYDEKYCLKYIEATAEESTHFYQTINNTTDFLVRLPEFINWLDSLDEEKKVKFMKSIYVDPENAMGPIYRQIAETKFRVYISKYKDVESRPKMKWGGEIQGCEASIELNLSKSTMIPVNMLNKELTLYQRGRLKDWVMCNSLNSYKEWQEFNKRIWKGMLDPEVKAHYRDKMESLAEKIENRLDRKKD